MVHLAGRGDVAESRRDPVGYAELNATGALHALEAARAAGAAFVLASSQRVYPLQPEPCREDDAARARQPVRLRQVGGRAVVPHGQRAVRHADDGAALLLGVRPGPAGQWRQRRGDDLRSSGAGGRAAGRPVRRAARLHRRARRGARASALAIDANASGTHRVYNIATGVGTTFRELAEQVVDATGSASTIEERDRRAARARPRRGHRARASGVGLPPCVELRAGLDRYIEWLRRNSA